MTQLLEEYLVKIKYQSDDTSKNNMLSGLKETSNIVMGISKAIIGAVTATAGITYTLSKAVNSMYLESRNLGNSTVSSFRSITEAAQDVGSSVDQMSSSLNNLEKFRRMTGSGANQFLSQFSGTNLTGKNTTDVMMDIIKNIPNLKKQGMREETFLNAMEVGGMGYDVGYQAWERPDELIKQYQKHKVANGSGIDNMAPGIHDQMTQFSVDIDKAMNVGATHFGEMLQQVNATELSLFESAIKAFDENASKIESGMKEFAKVITDSITPAMNELKNKYSTISKELNSISASLEKVVNPFESIGSFFKENWGILSTLSLTASFFGASIKNSSAANSSAGVIEKQWMEHNAAKPGDIGTLTKIQAAKEFAEKTESMWKLAGIWLARAFMLEVGYGIGKILENFFHPGADLGATLYTAFNEDVYDNPLVSIQKKMSQSNSPFGVSAREKTAMESLMGMGMSKNDASAVMASLSKETSNLDPFAEGDNGSAYGIEQWHGDRQGLYKNLFGHSMRSVTDQNQAFSEQLAFINWERLNSEKNNWAKMQSTSNDPYYRGAAYSREIVRPGLTDEQRQIAADERGMAALGFAQQARDINITVNGVTDPKAAADIVMAKLKEKTSANSRYNQTRSQ